MVKQQGAASENEIQTLGCTQAVRGQKSEGSSIEGQFPAITPEVAFNMSYAYLELMECELRTGGLVRNLVE